MSGRASRDPRTVGRLRELIAGLPDETPVCLRWAKDAKDLDCNTEPYPRLRGFDVASPKTGPVLQVRVAMQWLSD